MSDIYSKTRAETAYVTAKNVTTVYSKENTAIFEFDKEKEAEAREVFEKMQGSKILSEIVYFNDPCFTSAAV